MLLPFLESFYSNWIIFDIYSKCAYNIFDVILFKFDLFFIFIQTGHDYELCYEHPPFEN